MSVVRIAVPNKGRLSEGATSLLSKTGLSVPQANDRKLLADIGKGKYQILFASARDIPEYVEIGAADVGITGLDIVMETDRRVEKLLDLNFGRCKLVVACPEGDQIQSIDEIPEGACVATSFPRLTVEFFRKIGKQVKVLAIAGAAEVTPQIGVADLIADLVETGSTLRMNRLKPIGTIMDSWAVFIANAESIVAKETEIKEFTRALESIIEASQRRYLMANVPVASLDQLKAFLPGISGPTIMSIMGREDMVAVHAVVDVDEVDAVITILKNTGGEGILVVPIERMVV